MISPGKIVGKSIKALFYLLIFAVNAILLWRIFTSGDPSSLKTILVNENTLSAYEKYGNELQMFGQEQRTLSSDGKFSVTDAVFIPEAQQLQITVRYNNSTVRGLVEDFELDETPSRKDELFDITVVKTLDLTPENKKDNTDSSNLRTERYYPTKCVSEYKTLYCYRKLIFDGITVEDAVGVFADMYYVGDIDYEQTPYGVVCLYDSEMEPETVKLSRSDIKALEKAKSEK